MKLETIMRAYLLAEQDLQIVRPFGGPRVKRCKERVDRFHRWLIAHLFND